MGREGEREAWGWLVTGRGAAAGGRGRWNDGGGWMRAAVRQWRVRLPLDPIRLE